MAYSVKKKIVETARVSFEVNKALFDELQDQRNKIKEKGLAVEYDWNRAVRREIASMNKVIAVELGEAPAPKKRDKK